MKFEYRWFPGEYFISLVDAQYTLGYTSRIDKVKDNKTIMLELFGLVPHQGNFK